MLLLLALAGYDILDNDYTFLFYKLFRLLFYYDWIYYYACMWA